ncbi:MAG: hypothetical protein MUF49_11110 [Oculatellaceae cyanobacterium Prado106]|jgi:hypothetical protein|nr:hypothetical protein [Oculatellaceae cyanobacterium Prado106]
MSVQPVDLAVRYVTDASGTPTDVLVPLEVWEALIASLVDQNLVQQIQSALAASKMVGSENFVRELEQLAAFEESSV